MSKEKAEKATPPASGSEIGPETVPIRVEDLKLLEAAAERQIAAEETASKALAAEKDARARAERAEAQLVDARRTAEIEAGRARGAGEQCAELERERRALRERCATLENETERMHESFAALRQQLQEAIAGGASADKLDPLREGHRRVITIQAFSFEADRRTQTVPMGTVLQVPEGDFQNDRLRRFPHLKDHSEHLEETRKKAERAAVPVNQGRAALEQILERVQDVMRLRKEQRSELVGMMNRPEAIADRVG